MCKRFYAFLLIAVLLLTGCADISTPTETPEKEVQTEVTKVTPKLLEGNVTQRMKGENGSQGMTFYENGDVYFYFTMDFSYLEGICRDGWLYVHSSIPDSEKWCKAELPDAKLFTLFTDQFPDLLDRLRETDDPLLFKYTKKPDEGYDGFFVDKDGILEMVMVGYAEWIDGKLVELQKEDMIPSINCNVTTDTDGNIIEMQSDELGIDVTFSTSEVAISDDDVIKEDQEVVELDSVINLITVFQEVIS